MYYTANQLQIPVNAGKFFTYLILKIMHYKELLIMASLFLVCLSLYFSDEIIYFVKKNIKKIKSKNLNKKSKTL